MTVEVDDQGVIRDLRWWAAATATSRVFPALVKGMKAEEAIARLKGINCGGRGTSCPDQFAARTGSGHGADGLFRLGDLPSTAGARNRIRTERNRG